MFSEHPLLRRFENHLDVGEHRLEWTTQGEDFFFRPRDGDVEIIWCCLQCSDYRRQLLFPRQSKKVIHRLRKQFTDSHVWNFYPFTEDCELIIYGAFAMLRFRGVNDLAQLQLRNYDGSARTPISDIRKIGEAVASKAPQIERIRKAICCSPQERGWSNVSWPWGTHEELRKLLRAMASIVRQPEYGTGQWNFQLRNRFDSCIIPMTLSNVSVTPDPLSYEAFLQRLRASFPIRIERVALCSTRGDLREELWPSLIISAQMPTAHEKLEALLLWRDLLKDKIPAAEVDDLLRPFQ